MYRLYLENLDTGDKQLFYISGSSEPEVQIISGSLDPGISSAGKLEFVIPPQNIVYNTIQKLANVVSVWWDTKHLWTGRVIDSTKDIYGRMTVTCEGVMAFLLDGVTRPYSASASAADHLYHFLTEYNGEVEASKRLEFRVESDVSTDVYDVDISNYPNTLNAINENIIEPLGLYTSIERSGDTFTFVISSISGPASEQMIEFGNNMLDLEEFIDGTSVFTYLVPLGASTDGVPLTISSVNDGLDYIYDSSAVSLFGKIWRSETWDEIEDASTLLATAQEHLAKNLELSVTITIKAIDLSLLTNGYTHFWPGQSVKIVSLPHGLNAYFTCTEAAIDLTDPSQSTFTFGYGFDSLTDADAGQNRDIDAAQSTADNAALQSQKALSLAEHGIVNISRNGTVYTATRADGSTFSFTQQDTNTWEPNTSDQPGYVAAPGPNAANKVWKTDDAGNPGWRDDANTTYSAGTGINQSGTVFSLASGVVTPGSAGPTADVTGNGGTTIKVPRITVDTYGRVTALSEKTLTNVNTWRGIQNDLTSDSTTDSLSAAQGKALQNGKVSKSGDTMTGALTITNQVPLRTRNTGITTGAVTDSIVYGAGINCLDANNNLLCYFRPVKWKDGGHAAQIETRKVINGTPYYNTLGLTVKPDGTREVQLSHPDAWRSSLGLSELMYWSAGTYTATVPCFGWIDGDRHPNVVFILPKHTGNLAINITKFVGTIRGNGSVIGTASTTFTPTESGKYGGHAVWAHLYNSMAPTSMTGHAITGEGTITFTLS